MGHIELSAPDCMYGTRRILLPGLLLDISATNLDRVLYFAQYVVTFVDENLAREAAPPGRQNNRDRA
jgi:DNA-directed RNA polymerase subunit beta'